jgi:hypothetical protein
MADGQLARNMFWAPLKFQQKTRLRMRQHRHRAKIADVLCSIGLHERLNLILFSLAEVFVGHKQLRLPGQEALNDKHLQSPNLQLF